MDRRIENGIFARLEAAGDPLVCFRSASGRRSRVTLLKQNSELKADRIWNWTLPAWVTTLDDGRVINVCPKASACAKVCYARNGTYNFKNVKAAHQRNLKLVLDDLDLWLNLMREELAHKRMRPSGKARLLDH